MSRFKKRVEELGLIGAPAIDTERLTLVDLAAMDSQILSDQRQPFTLARAAEYIDLPVFPGERDVATVHCQTLCDEIRRGRFNWDIVIIAKASLGDRQFKINGQHTSWARVAALPDDVNPQVRFLHYKVDSEEQLKALYSSFDRAKGRSDPHLTRVELVGSVAAEGLDKHTISRLAPAFKFWLYPQRTDYDRIGPAELARVITVNHTALFNTAGRFVESVEKSCRPAIVKQPVLAAVLETFNKVPTVAPSFWKDVAEGTNLTKSDARWHLRKYLDETAVAQKSRTADKRVVAAEDLFRVSVLAWNRWRKGEKVSATLRPTMTRAKVV